MRGLKHTKDVGNQIPCSSRIFYRCVDWNINTHIGEISNMKSHLLQMRGLKPSSQSFVSTFWKVASFTDAWIETDRLGNRLWWVQSHLLQMRGLKHTLKRLTITLKSRIFYRCVDWNYEQAKNLFLRKEVASFTDAWIETSFRARM